MPNDKVCKNCGALNNPDANYCAKCGSALPRQRPVSSKKGKHQKGQESRLESIYFIGAAFVISLAIVFMIWESNRQNLMAKITQHSHQTAEHTEHDHSDELLQKIEQNRDQLKAGNRSFDLLVSLGNNFFDLGQYDSARVYYHQAVDIRSDVPGVLIDLGVSYFNLNQAQEALAYIQKALEVEPSHRQGLFNLGVVYYNLNQPDIAIATWEKLQAAHPNSQESRVSQNFIRQIRAQNN